MFNIKIVADTYNRADGTLIREREVLSGAEWDGWTAPSALDAFELLASHLGYRQRDHVEKNFKVVVRRSEMMPWCDGEMAPFGSDVLDNFIEELGDSGLVDENWEGIEATDEDRLALSQALNTALANWAEERSIASNVYHEPGEPILELPAHLDICGCIALADEDLQRLADLA